MRSYFLYSCLFLFCCGACKKISLPDPVDEIPVFSLNADLDGQNLNINSGEENYFMFSSFEQDSLDVYSFIGRFEQVDCVNECKEIFTIKIRDEGAITGTVNINTALGQNFYNYTTQDNTTTEVQIDTIGFHFNTTFDASQSIIPPQGNIFYTWGFGTGIAVTSLDNSTAYNFTSPFPMGTEIPVSLTISDNFGICSSTQTQVINFSNNAEPNCTVSIVNGDSLPTMDISSLSAIPSGVAPFTYTWNTGATTETADVAPNHQYYAVTVTDAEGCISSANIIAGNIFGGGNLNCLAAFDLSTEKVYDVDSTTTVITDHFQFSTVEIEYIDEMGKVYNSLWGLQDELTHEFQILNVEDFEMNENGEPTKKLALQFNCKLYSADNEMIILENGNAVIAVAYPN